MTVILLIVSINNTAPHNVIQTLKVFLSKTLYQNSADGVILEVAFGFAVLIGSCLSGRRNKLLDTSEKPVWSLGIAHLDEICNHACQYIESYFLTIPLILNEACVHVRWRYVSICKQKATPRPPPNWPPRNHCSLTQSAVLQHVSGTWTALTIYAKPITGLMKVQLQC
jgi:hypothetical protein